MSPLRRTHVTALLALGAAVCPARADVSPGELVDSGGLAWQASPPAAFSSLTNAAAYDGTDALGMAATLQGPTVLETSVTGPAVVSWYWRRVQNGAPGLGIKLYFLYDGKRVADHDDEERWEKVVIQIPSGTHSFRWYVPPDAESPSRAVLDLVSVYPNLLLPEPAAMNDPRGVWLRTELGTQWKVVLNENHDGASAVEARPDRKNQATSLRRLVNGPADISWWWKVQGDEQNQLKAKLRRVSSDNTALVSSWELANASPWQQVITTVPSGPHVINWRYEYKNPADVPAGAAAFGVLDEFFADELEPAEALGMPNQVWQFGGDWEVSLDTSPGATPGSLKPAAGQAGAWIESSFSGPALLHWGERSEEAGVQLDGTPAGAALAGTPFTDALGWRTRYLILPAGHHTVRWNYTSAQARFEHPGILPAMSALGRAALGQPGGAFYEPASQSAVIVSNAPGGPDGDTALRLAATNSPQLVLDGPRLVTYYYRKWGVTSGPLRETVSGVPRAALAETTEWTRRSMFIAGPAVVGWNTSGAGAGGWELDGFQMEAPEADPAAFLARSGLNWTATPGAAVARLADPAVPPPGGEVLFLPGPASSIESTVTGPGVLEVDTTDRYFLPLGNQLSPGLDATPLLRMTSTAGDRTRYQFAVPGGTQAVRLTGQGGAAVLRMEYQGAAAPVVSPAAHAGAEGEGMVFYSSDPQHLEVEDVNDAGGIRRVLTVRNGLPQPEVTAEVKGPGLLAFEWRASESGGGVFTAGSAIKFFSDAAPGQWRSMRIVLPPGPQTLRWRVYDLAPESHLQLDHVRWQAWPAPGDPPGGLIDRVSGTDLLLAGRDGEQVLSAPVAASREGVPLMTVPVEGGGMFVCEARVLMSHPSPHFQFLDGKLMSEVYLDGALVHRSSSCNEWLTLTVPLPDAAAHEIVLKVADETRPLWAVPGILPAKAEMRRLAVLPLQTPAQASLPGVTWSAGGTPAPVSSRWEGIRGTGTVWHLAAPSADRPEDQPKVTVQLDGPGVLEWESSGGTLISSLTNPGGIRFPINNSSEVDPPMPSHQLMVPPGRHSLTWERRTSVFAPDTAMALHMRWLPGPKAGFAAALPPGQPYPLHLTSDGGWEPAPFDLDTPWQRLRTKVPGPAAMQLLQPAGPGNGAPVTFWQLFGPSALLGESRELAYNSIPAGTGPVERNFFFPAGGDLGAMLWPCDRAYLGRLPEASSPYDGELYEAWAARMGVPADPLADPDNDGVSNLMECALGTDPAYREGQGWDILPGSPPVMRVLWPCFVPPNLWRDVEGSNDLEQWTSSDLKAECDEGPATLSLFSWKYARFIVRKL